MLIRVACAPYSVARSAALILVVVDPAKTEILYQLSGFFFEPSKQCAALSLGWLR